VLEADGVPVVAGSGVGLTGVSGVLVLTGATSVSVEPGWGVSVAGVGVKPLGSTGVYVAVGTGVGVGVLMQAVSMHSDNPTATADARDRSLGLMFCLLQAGAKSATPRDVPAF